MGKSNVSVTVSYLRYIFQMSILPYLSDTGAMYLEYLTEDTFKNIFFRPAFYQIWINSSSNFVEPDSNSSLNHQI